MTAVGYHMSSSVNAEHNPRAFNSFEDSILKPLESFRILVHRVPDSELDVDGKP